MGFESHKTAQPKHIKQNLQSQINDTKPTKPNPPKQIYQNNHTYQTKPIEPNLPNLASQAKRNQTNAKKVERLNLRTSERNVEMGRVDEWNDITAPISS